jgi:hypothetical protein
MCRNIKNLFNFEPPATDDEIHLSSMQFVRKLSGFNKPSRINEEAFDLAVQDVAAVARTLIDSLRTDAPAKNRELESTKSRARRRQKLALQGARNN